MDDDDLKGLTIWRGNRFVGGEEYFDLDNPARGPFVATGDEGAPSGYTYVARGQASEGAWTRLITWQQPLSADQAGALQAQQAMFQVNTPQSAAGEARESRVDVADLGRRLRGTIDRLVTDRGFGFIAADDGREFFFQVASLQGVDFGDLAPGIPVRFTVGDDPGDQSDEHPRAVSVTRDAV
jgi:cold shock CspA family protein